jgi:hypothetical protein
LFVADPLRHVFVRGENTKVLSDPDKSFSQYIVPLYVPRYAFCISDPTPLPNFYIDPDKVEIDDPTITIYNVTPGNNQSTWTILGSSFVDNQSSFDYTLPFQEGNYTVQLISETSLGCKDSLLLTASVQDNVALYVPNSCTPDGEEFNTVFLPIFSTGFTPINYRLSIYLSYQSG